MTSLSDQSNWTLRRILSPAALAGENGWTPLVPDAPAEEFEYMPVVILDGREYGRREQIDICRTYAYAVELGQVFVRNVGRGATYAILRRRVGLWEEASS